MLNIRKFKYFATIALVSPVLSTLYAQERVYEAPQVTIFSSPEQVFELPGSGEYIGPERLKCGLHLTSNPQKFVFFMIFIFEKKRQRF